MPVRFDKKKLVIEILPGEEITSIEEAKELMKSEDLLDSVKVLEFLLNNDIDPDELSG